MYNTNENTSLDNTAVTKIAERLFYVEPNDVYGSINGIPLTPDYTDMCISFDLEVETVPRSGYVSGEKSNEEKEGVKTYHIFWTSYKTNSNPQDNTVSFGQGTKYLDRSYQTTYYTDIHFNDFSQGDTIEGLGVESVNVAFENYYTPTIKIKFIDVRGATMFGRQEAIHTDDRITQDSIWGCFFTFPYPKFRLQIKGFYGHPVTYQLSCTDFRGTFNSTTGNFEIDTTFLGYDFGILADIPTAYLIAAPYSKYVGADYWHANVSEERWKLSDGNAPKKLKEIMGDIRTAMRYTQTTENGEAVSDGDDGTEYTEKLNERIAVEDLYNAYKDVVSVITGSFVGSEQMTLPVSNNEGKITELYYFSCNGNRYYMFNSQQNAFWKIIADKTGAFYEKVKQFKTNYPYDGVKFDDDSLLFGREVTKDEVVGKNGPDSGVLLAMLCKEFNVEHKYAVSIGTNFLNDEPIKFILKSISKFTKYVNGKFVDVEGGWTSTVFESTNGYQIVPEGKTRTLIYSLKDDLKSYMATEDTVSEEEQDETDSYLSRLNIYEAAGLLPTLENVFKTIMCHLETFIAMIYKCKSNIDTQITAGKRKPAMLGMSDIKFIDSKGNTGDFNVPPWPAVSVTESKLNNGTQTYDSVQTTGWVGAFNGETEWEEAKFIEGLSLAWKKISKEMDSSELSYKQTSSIVCLPSDVYSDVFPDVASKNPYVLGEYMGIRAAALFGVVGYNTNSAESLGKADALNFYSRYGKEYIKETIINFDGWKDILLKAPISNDKNPCRRYTVNPGCESFNDQILTNIDANFYSYTYSKMIKGVSDEYTIIPVVEGDFSSIFSSPNAIFNTKVDSEETSYQRRKIVNARLKNNQCNLYFDFGTKKFKEINNVNGRFFDETNFDEETFTNPAMFSIYNEEINSEYYNKLNKQSVWLNNGAINVGKYKDVEKVWRDELKGYWDVNYNVNEYLRTNIKEFRFGIADGSEYAPKISCIFHSPLYYAQNTANTREIKNADVIESSKCLLFLLSSGYDIKKAIDIFKDGEKNKIFQKIPYGIALMIGGLIWRTRQIIEPINIPKKYGYFDFSQADLKFTPLSESSIPAISPISRSDATSSILGTSLVFETFLRFSNDKTECYNKNWTIYFDYESQLDLNVSNTLVNLFRKFVKDEWNDIRNGCEKLKENKFIYSYETFNEYINTVNEEEKNKEWVEIKKYCSNILDKYVILTRGTLRVKKSISYCLIDKSQWNNYAKGFSDKLEDIVKTESISNIEEISEKSKIDTDLKLAMYMYTKHIWDRWFMMCSMEQFKVENFMKNFVFMDSFYRNIGSMLHINCEKLYNALSNINGESMLFQLLSKITTDHNCAFFAFPDYFGLGDDEKSQTNVTNNYMTPEQKLADIFTPIPFSRKPPMTTSNKFVVMLVYNQSENLSDYNGYADNAFDIFSHDGSTNILPATFNVPAISSEVSNASEEEKRVKRYGYNIPAFGVTFGRQNNSIFKTIDVSMTNPITTEQSINALTIIAERSAGNEKAISFYGQDLFPVYNGYSYNCTITMMGNAQIMPLMYFQLMNIPMFRGTYMIYSVTHTMKPGDMTTTIKGVKLSKNALPFAQGWYTTALVVGDNGELTDISGYRIGDTVYSEDCIPSTWDTQHFKLIDMIRSNKAKQLGVDNSPSTDICVKLHSLMVNCLEKIREIYGDGIRVSSGYRSKLLNEALRKEAIANGKSNMVAQNSQHTYGEAADISPIKGKSDMKALFEAAIKFGDFDQLILEKVGGSSWIHVSYRSKNRRHNVYYYGGGSYIDIKNNWQEYFS